MYCNVSRHELGIIGGLREPRRVGRIVWRIRALVEISLRLGMLHGRTCPDAFVATFVDPWRSLALLMGSHPVDSGTAQEAFVPRPRPSHSARFGDGLKTVGWKLVSMSLHHMVMERF